MIQSIGWTYSTRRAGGGEPTIAELRAACVYRELRDFRKEITATSSHDCGQGGGDDER